MITKVRQYILDNCMIETHDQILLGLSGGPDSVCLLLTLHELQKDMEFDLQAVHVNHLLRGADADADEAYVMKLCDRLGVELTIIHKDVEEFAKEKKLSTEEAGRMVRREAMGRIADNLEEKWKKPCKIALAHHMDDNVETVIHNMSRGTGIRGISGMKPVNGNYIRPLLGIRRGEIEAFLKEQKVKACIDETNLEDGYTRNRIRNHVIPYLETEVNDQAVKHIHNLATQMSELREFLDRQVERAWMQVVTSLEDEQGIYAIDIPALQSLDQALIPYLLQRILYRASGQEKDIDGAHLKALGELVWKQTGRQIDLPYGLVARRSYNQIVLEKEVKTCDSMLGERGISLDFGEKQESAEVLLPDGTKIALKVFDIANLSMPIEERTYTKWFDYGIISGGVVVRTRQSGDEIVVDREGHAQKLKKFFINEKIPSKLRDKVWLIAEGSDILWAIGSRQSKKYQITSNTKKVLEINVMNSKGDYHGREY